jgi:hypothetical protein
MDLKKPTRTQRILAGNRRSVPSLTLLRAAQSATAEIGTEISLKFELVELKRRFQRQCFTPLDRRLIW